MFDWRGAGEYARTMTHKRWAKRVAGAAVLTLVAAAGFAEAAQRYPLGEVDADALVEDTQITLKGAGDDHTAMAWWVPIEFWKSVLSRDEGTGEAEKREILEVLEGVTLIAGVQADISALGGFNYYTKDEVLGGMMVTHKGPDGKARRLVPVEKIDRDLQMVLNMLKPVLEAAMGELGSNMHFYVFDDGGEGERLVDPYAGGKISIAMEKRNKEVISGDIRLPVDALFVPRKCPNGENADITWSYCPWTGGKLD